MIDEDGPSRETEQLLAMLDGQIMRERRHRKSMGCGLTVTEMATNDKARCGLIDLERRGFGRYLKSAATDPWGWCWLRSPELRELIQNYEPVGDDSPACATTRHAPGEVRTKSFKMRLPTPHDETLPDRTFQAIISTADIDADGEIVVPDGMDYSRFEGSPRLLLDHDQSKPIGRVVELERVDEGWRMTATLTARPADADPEAYWLANEAWYRIHAGELAAVSVSFLPMKSHPDVDDQGRAITVHDEWELLEVSVVPVGSNPRARITGIGGANSQSAAA